MANFWVCGSVAFDTIFDYGADFSEHFIEGQLNNINTSFYVPEMRKAFGGCAGNICYSTAKLGLSPAMVAAVGKVDFAPYAERLGDLGVNVDHVLQADDAYTAQAYMIHDVKGNQISAFHPGAMEQSGDISLHDANGIELALIGPDSLAGILQHADDCAALGVPILFDPGQSIPIIDADNMRGLIDKATWLVVNSYEFEAILQKTGMSLAEVREQLNALIVTQGGDGAMIYTAETDINIAPIPVKAVDTVGAGDAYRAGLIYGLLNQLDWKTTGQIAGLCGAYKVEVHGPQNYDYTQAEFATRYESVFGEAIEL